MSASAAGAERPGMSESLGSGSIAVLRRNCQPPVCRWLAIAESVEKVSLGTEKVRNKQASQQAGEGKKKTEREFEKNKSRICNEILSGTGIGIMHIYYDYFFPALFRKERERFHKAYFL